MAFVSAKCPSCGASLKVPDNKDFVICEFCESNVKVREAVRLYTEADIPDWLILAKSAMKMGKISEGLHYYIKILEVDATVSEAWLGRADATGRLLLGNLNTSLHTPAGGTQVIRNFDGSTQIFTTHVNAGRTVHLRNTSGQFKDLNQIFSEIGKAFAGKNYYDQGSIQNAFKSYNNYLVEIKAYINNAEEFAQPMELEDIKKKSVTIYTEIIDGIYNNLKMAYKDSYLSQEDLFPGYLDFTISYLTDLEELRVNDPNNRLLTGLLFKLSSENARTASDFLAIAGTERPRLESFKLLMEQKSADYLKELEEYAKQT